MEYRNSRASFVSQETGSCEIEHKSNIETKIETNPAEGLGTI